MFDLGTEEITAYATVAAVVVALIVPLVGRAVHWWSRPRLEVSFSNAYRYCRLIPDAIRSDVWVVRLKVENTGGRLARGLQGKLIHAELQSGAIDQHMDQVQLQWAGATNGYSSIVLAPAQAEFLNVLSVRLREASSFSIYPEPPAFEGQIYTCPFDGQRLLISVVGDDVEPQYVQLQLPRRQRNPWIPKIGFRRLLWNRFPLEQFEFTDVDVRVTDTRAVL